MELANAHFHTYGKIVGANSGSTPIIKQSITHFLEIHTPRFHHKDRSHSTNSSFQLICLSAITVLTLDATPMDCWGITRLPRVTCSIHSCPGGPSIILDLDIRNGHYLRTNQTHKRQTRGVKSLLRVSFRSDGCLPRYRSSLDWWMFECRAYLHRPTCWS